MNKTLTTTAVGALIALASYAAPALAEVGVSISVGQPGFYGRIDLMDAPQPRLYYRRPVAVERSEYYQEPIYLHVPPRQVRNWRRHCHRYDACSQPVYFVSDRWYNDVYVPHYRERSHRRHDDDRYHRHDRRDDDWRDHDRRDGRHDGHDGRDHDDGHREDDGDGRRRDDARGYRN